VSLENLHNLLPVYRPVLKGASACLPLIFREILFKKEVSIVIFNFQVDFTGLQVIHNVVKRIIYTILSFADMEVV
jgi:hypothetical protein